MTSLGRKEDLFDLKKDKGDASPPSFVAVHTSCEALDRRGFANHF